MYRSNSCEIDWLQELPYTISAPHFDAMVVHAGFVPGIPVEEQSTTDMYLLRTVPDNSSGVSEGMMIFIK
jgi:hypothetical protein